MTKEHQGLPVAGYRPQTDEKVALVNVNKALEEHLLRLMDELQGRDVDFRWLQIARTHIEHGFMAVPEGPGLGVEVDERKIAKYRI